MTGAARSAHSVLSRSVYGVCAPRSSYSVPVARSTRSVPAAGTRRHVVLAALRPRQPVSASTAADEHGTRGSFDPYVGYEWCSRCYIQDHRFQKHRGLRNACENLPKGQYCDAARQWWWGKFNVMLISFGFAWLGAWTAGLTTVDEKVADSLNVDQVGFVDDSDHLQDPFAPNNVNPFGE